MSVAQALRRPLLLPEHYIPTWLFDEETILVSLSGLDDELLLSIDLGRFCVGLRERTLEAAGSGASA